MIRMQSKKPAKRAFKGLVGRPTRKPSDPFADRVPLPPLSKPEPTREEIRAEKARLRAQKNRDKRKQAEPEVTREKERKRKAAERKEIERKAELKKLLDSGQHPVSLDRLRTKNGPPLTVINNDGKTTGVATGGHDTAKLEQEEIASINRQGGPSAEAKRTTPKGHGPDSTKPGLTFIHTIRYLPDKYARAMRAFIGNHFTGHPMVCAVCREQIAPEFSHETGFIHLQEKHPQLFEDMLHKIRTAKKCPEDHDAMAAKYGNGLDKLYCQKCNKLLYKPSKPGKVRTDTTAPAETTVETADNSVIPQEIQPIQQSAPDGLIL